MAGGWRARGLVGVGRIVAGVAGIHGEERHTTAAAFVFVGAAADRWLRAGWVVGDEAGEVEDL